MKRLYPNNLKNGEFGEEAPQNSHLERANIVGVQGASEDENFEEKPTLPKTHSSSCLGIIFTCLLACTLLHADDDDDNYKGCIVTQQATISSTKIRLNFEGEYEALFTLSDGSTWMTQSDEDFQTIVKAPWALTDVLLLINHLDHWTARNFTHESEVILVPLCNKRLLLN